MNQLGELCLPQYVKMFDPTNKNENKEDQIEVAADDQSEDEVENDTETSSKLEKDKIKYGSEFKFHYIIMESGGIGDALPDIITLTNPCPGEPKFLRKRKHPKALRFFKVKRDLNPSRFFLHELMMYKNFDEKDYERWHDDEKCQDDYILYKDKMQKVKSKIMEWLEDIEEARFFVEEDNKNDLDLEETGEIMDPENIEKMLSVKWKAMKRMNSTHILIQKG